METGSNKSLFTLIAVVIFGIFLSLSYWLFQDQFKGVLASVFNGVSSGPVVRMEETLNPAVPPSFISLGTATNDYMGMMGSDPAYSLYTTMGSLDIELVGDLGKTITIDLENNEAFHADYVTLMISLRSPTYNTDYASLSPNFVGIVDGKERYQSVISTPYSGLTSFKITQVYHVKISNGNGSYLTYPVTTNYSYYIGDL